MKLDLNDLRPAESSLTLSEKPGKTYTLKKISLATQIWIRNRFGTEKIQGIFENQSLPEISEIAHHLIKDKTDFPTVESLQEAIVTQQDRINLLTAMMQTVGISQPILAKLTEAQAEGNALSPSPPTGANSTT